MFKKQHKLFYQVVNAIIICSIIITILVGIVILTNSMYNVTEEAKEKFLYLVGNYAYQIDIRIASTESIISEMGNFISSTIDLDRLEEDSEYNLFATNTIHTALKNSAESKEYVYDYFFILETDSYNTLITSENIYDSLEGSEIYDIIKNNSDVIGNREVWLDFKRSDNLFFYVEPFFIDGEFSGYIGGRFRPNSFLWGIYDSANIYFSDTILYDTSYSQIVLNHNLPGKLVTLTPELKQLTQTESSGVTEVFDNQDKDIISSFSHLNNGWVMVVSMEKSHVLSRSLELIKMLIMLVIIGSIFSVFIASSVSERIVKPIDTIVALVKRIGGGDLAVPIPSEFLEYENEIGTLASSIEVMRTSLKDYIHEIEEHSQHLESEVSNRTIELTAANSQLNNVITEMKKKDIELTESHTKLVQTLFSLKETQQELLKSQKIAALTSLVRGVSHKLNTPVGTSITSLSYLNQEMRSFFKEIDLSCDNSAPYHKEMYELLDIASITMNNLIKTRDILDTLRDITSDSTSEKQHQFNFSRMLTELISALRIKKEYKQFTIQLDLEENIWLNSYPSVFTQIFTHLVSNSVIHGFKDRNHGVINIEIQTDDNSLNIVYTDNGVGILGEEINKIFDPFYTTNLSTDTSGLGLSVIYNQVTLKLNGSIDCDNSTTGGAQFKIKIPMS